LQNDSGVGAQAGTTFNNAGTLTKSSGTNTSSFALPFTNSGQVQVQSGTLDFQGGGDETGSFVVAANATLVLGDSSPGDYTLGPGSRISGAGNVAFNSNGNATVNLKGTYNVSGSSAFGNGNEPAVNLTSPVTNLGSSVSITGFVSFNTGQAITIPTLNLR